MFTGNMAEAKANHIELKDIDPLALVLLIEFVYTSEIQVTEENVQGADPVSLPVESVCKLICSDQLAVISEEQVLEAVLSWVNHDRSSRQEVISQLMENVHLPLMSQEYLMQRVEEEPLMKANCCCKDFLFEAMKFHLLKGEQKAIFKTPRTIPRTPRKVILVIGGDKGREVFSSVDCFDIKGDRWHQQLAVFPSKRSRCGVAVVNGMVYVVGGLDERLRTLSTVVMYDPSKDLWTSCPEMKKRREFLGVTVLNYLIYAVGDLMALRMRLSNLLSVLMFR
ncbi:kelch-like protein 2 [Dreissena polymorpha]|uniref:kelch-like protein 2 n=1 Tax=Dreissena polymorpha TaxID=45954 RepID=UPI0022644779|nr:kelch-like protein 2 [Dreissena polymorpha]